MATATHGSAIVFPAETFDPEATLRSVQDEQCTALYGVPTMFSAELELIQNGTVSTEGFQHLRTGIAAGSSIPAELMRKLHKTLNLTDLTICYGMTETSPVSAMTTTDDPLEKRINSVGRLLPHVEAKIVDPLDRTKILPVGARGELAVSGYLVMQGYWGDPEKTMEVMIPDENGKIWMHTGDEGAMDADGYIQITGRIKDLVIRGGENIHPLEVENCVLGHPGVAEVSVVGLPDERYGEVVAAFVVRNKHQAPLREEDIRIWVAERLSRHLGKLLYNIWFAAACVVGCCRPCPLRTFVSRLTTIFMVVPKYIFWVDGYPKTASGKIQKFKLQSFGKALVAEGKGTTGGMLEASTFA
ncbi:Acyl-CoA synthetase member 2 mitochondrial [Lambiella insularis]|nr:Acyl-CoA synthetase member 2 mitochondrial [Lambiella insularis]